LPLYFVHKSIVVDRKLWQYFLKDNGWMFFFSVGVGASAVWQVAAAIFALRECQVEDIPFALLAVASPVNCHVMSQLSWPPSLGLIKTHTR